eukprot:GEMP01035747.1.p1 GENE.GEMP01035747.1~~GEMP01035747.1.p1  ORF type:complete len:380 (+),score=49.04 GEMP01035747.1:236-1375(+)
MHIRVIFVLLSQLTCPSASPISFALPSIPSKIAPSLRGFRRMDVVTSDISEIDSDATSPALRRLAGQLKGLCRYGKDLREPLRNPQRMGNFTECKNNCLLVPGCTAFAYDWNIKEHSNCFTYGKQVYTFGTTRKDTVCENVPACDTITTKDTCEERKSVCEWDAKTEKCLEILPDYLIAIGAPAAGLGVVLCVVFCCLMRKRTKGWSDSSDISQRFPKGNNMGKQHEEENKKDMKLFQSKLHKSDAKEKKEIRAYKKRRAKLGYGVYDDADDDDEFDSAEEEEKKKKNKNNKVNESVLTWKMSPQSSQNLTSPTARSNAMSPRAHTVASPRARSKVAVASKKRGKSSSSSRTHEKRSSRPSHSRRDDGKKKRHRRSSGR